MVRRAERYERQLVVARVAGERLRRLQHLLGRALEPRTVDDAGLAEAAALRAAALDLDRHAVVHGLQERHDRRRQRRRQLLHEALRHARGQPFDRRRHGLDRAVGVVLGPVEARHVDAPDLRELQQHLVARAAPLLLPLAHEVDDVDDRLLAVAQREHVDEVRQRVRVERAGAAADHERVRVGALLRLHRQARQVEHVQDVRVRALVAQREADDVELAHGVARLEAPERHALGAHRVFHVGPRREDALGQHALAAVDDVVEDAEPQVRHADVVEVGVGEDDADVAGVPVLDGRVPLAAGVARGLLHARKQRFKVPKSRHGMSPPSAILW